MSADTDWQACLCVGCVWGWGGRVGVGLQLQ